MKRTLITLLFALFAIANVDAQIYQKVSGYGYGWDRVRPDSVLHLPDVSDTLTLKTNSTRAQIRVVNDSIWWWKGYWRNLSRGGFDSTSLSNRINQRVKYTDTASMLSPYGRISNGANFRIPYFTGSQSFSASDSLRWDYTNRRFHIGTVADLGARLNIYTYNANDAIDVRGGSGASGYALKITNDTGGGTVMGYIDMVARAKFYTGGSSNGAIGLDVWNTSNSVMRVNGDESIYFGNGGTAPTIFARDGTKRYFYNSAGAFTIQHAGGNLLLATDVDSTAYKVQIGGNSLLRGVAKYATNYGSLLDDRSLTHKRYVDSLIGAKTFDTTTLSNRINLKLNISDTAAMLAPYVRSNIYTADGTLTGSRTVTMGTNTLLFTSVNASVQFTSAGTTTQIQGKTISFAGGNGSINDVELVSYADYRVGTIPGNKYLDFITGSTSRMRIFGSGNISINSTNDAGYKLDVNGTTVLRNTTTLFAGSTLVLNDATNTQTARLIHVTTPYRGTQFALQWNGSNVLGYNAGGINFLNSATNNDYLFINRSVFSGGATGGNGFTFEDGGSFAPTTGTNTYNLIRVRTVYNATGGTNTITGFSYDPILTSMTGVTHRAIHTVSGDVLFATTSGNVGIGTTSPSAKFDVIGSVRVRGAINYAPDPRPAITATPINGEINGMSNLSGTADFGFLRLSAGGGTSTNAKAYIDISGYNVNSDANNNLVFGTSGVERMRIFNTGNIAINSTTTDAGFRLDVNGTARVQSTLSMVGGITWGSNFSGDRISFGNIGSLGYGINIGGSTRLNIYGYTATGNNIDFGWSSTNDAAERTFTITRDGTAGGYLSILRPTTFGNITTRANSSALVQIESTSQGFLMPRMTTTQRDAISTPATGLQVYNTTTNVPNYFNGTSWVALSSGTGTNIYNSNGTINVTRTVTLDSNLIFTGSGSIAMGTSTPSDKLHVVGSGRITGNTIFSLGTSTMTVGSTGDGSYKLSVDGDLRLYGKIRTDTPTGGIGPGVWKLGAKRTGSVSLDTGNYVEVEIDGALYRLALVTLN